LNAGVTEMIDETEIPASLAERASLLENLLVERATSTSGDDGLYERLRREFVGDDTLRPLLPSFVRTCRSLRAFWGYAATTVDDICHAAGVTKGSFFHHFKSKDDLALSAAAYWGEMTEGFFASAPYHQSEDPLERLLGYVDFREEILRGDLPYYTCLLGTLVQETYATHPDFRAACDQGMSTHIAILMRDIEAAKKLYAPDAPWSAESVGYFIQSVLQGAFIFAKAKQGPNVVCESLAHLRRYLGLIFNQPCNTK
jgi:TetR/AcrR family transcriptional repressor of nem operon